MFLWGLKCILLSTTDQKLLTLWSQTMLILLDPVLSFLSVPPAILCHVSSKLPAIGSSFCCDAASAASLLEMILLQVQMGSDPSSLNSRLLTSAGYAHKMVFLLHVPSPKPLPCTFFASNDPNCMVPKGKCYFRMSASWQQGLSC